jgi:hypothetical protein
MESALLFLNIMKKEKKALCITKSSRVQTTKSFLKNDIEGV